MGQEILDRYQKIFLKEFVKNDSLRTNFYLSGGTALSGFYLHHRLSEDLDFFSYEDFSLLEIEPFIKNIQKILGNPKKTFTSIYDRRIFFLKLKGRELKIEFTKYPFKQLKNPVIFNNLKVDSLLDIGANKLFSIFDRTEVKDFVDLYFILKEGFSIKYLHKNMQKKFGIDVDSITLGSQIAKITNIKTIPDLLIKTSLSEIKSALTDEALSLKKEIG